MFEFYLIEMIFGSPWEAIEVVAVAVFFANVITVCTPNRSDNKFCQFLIDTLNAISMNIMQNANRVFPKRFPLPKKKKKKKASKGPPNVGGAKP